MVVYDVEAKKLLEEEIEYELWLLEFLSTENIFYEKDHLDFYTFINYKTNKSKGVNIYLGMKKGLHDVLLNQLRPLSFVSCFKILDLIFEWILKLNESNILNHIPKTKDKKYFQKGVWSFLFKIDLLESYDNVIDNPPFLDNNPDISKHLFELYKNLKDYRNAVIHKQNFDNSGSSLEITYDSNKLTISKDQLTYFFMIILTIAKILMGKIQLNGFERGLFKYYFDQIQNLHQYTLFNKKKPRLVDVEWFLDNTSKVDLNFIKNELKTYDECKNLEIKFNLLIIGIENDKINQAWNFKSEDIENIDILDLESSTYNDKLISNEELESLIHNKNVYERFKKE
ncbi:MAG: hypothetical protein FGO69_08755 [Methanobacterium sp.]|nr:MAG: hypothetical protein FGO69_08755 [Methanobacterium sp.]